LEFRRVLFRSWVSRDSSRRCLAVDDIEPAISPVNEEPPLCERKRAHVQIDARADVLVSVIKAEPQNSEHRAAGVDGRLAQEQQDPSRYSARRHTVADDAEWAF